LPKDSRSTAIILDTARCLMNRNSSTTWWG